MESLLQHIHGKECLKARDKLLARFPNVSAIYDNRDDGCIGRGAADAQLFKLFDEGGVGVASRRLCLMSSRVDFLQTDFHAFLERGQPTLTLFLGFVVLPFHVDAAIPVEKDLLASRSKN